MSNSSVNSNSLIAEKVAKVLVEPLEAKSVVLEAGPKIFDSSEPLRIPTLTDGFDPAWVGENELIPEDDAAFGEIALMPTERKSIKSITRVSNELIRMAAVGVDNVLQARLVKDVANKLDTALLIGDGADNTVTGILNQPGVQTSTPLTLTPCWTLSRSLTRPRLNQTVGLFPVLTTRRCPSSRTPTVSTCCRLWAPSTAP